MSKLETDRETLIREGDAEYVRQEEESRRKKLRDKAKDALSAAEVMEQAIEDYLKEHGKNSEKKQTTAQTQVTNKPEDKEPHHLKSKLGIAKFGTSSLRATVPEGIVVFLDLKPQDKLEWKMDIDDQTGERVAIVKKIAIKKS